MKRSARLQSAKHWLKEYRGKKLVSGYKRKFGVDEVCALIELKLLGQPIEELRIEKARISAIKQGERRARSKQKLTEQCHFSDSDENFYYIAGHTSNGFP